MSSKSSEKDNKVKKIAFLFISIIIALAILVFSVLNTTQDKTHFFPKSIAITLIAPFNLAQIQSF